VIAVATQHCRGGPAPRQVAVRKPNGCGTSWSVVADSRRLVSLTIHVRIDQQRGRPC